MGHTRKGRAMGEKAVDFSVLQTRSRGQLKESMWAIWLAGLAFAAIFGAVCAAGIGGTYFAYSFDSEYWFFITIGAGLVAVFVIWLFLAAMSFGKCASMNTMYFGGHSKVKISLSGFKHIWGAFSVQFMVVLLTVLWSLLLVVPGLVKFYSYSCAMYIKQENPSKSALQCITESRYIMNGYKLEKLLFDFYAWPWVLIPPTLGLFLLYFIPYRKQANYNFYQNAMGNVERAQQPFTPAPVPMPTQIPAPAVYHGMPMQGLNVQNTAIQDAIAQQVSASQPAPQNQFSNVSQQSAPASFAQFNQMPQPAPQDPPNGILAQNMQQQQAQSQPPARDNTHQTPLQPVFNPNAQQSTQPESAQRLGTIKPPSFADDDLDSFF